MLWVITFIGWDLQQQHFNTTGMWNPLKKWYQKTWGWANIHTDKQREKKKREAEGKEEEEVIELGQERKETA